MQPHCRRLFAGAANAASTMRSDHYLAAFRDDSGDNTRLLSH